MRGKKSYFFLGCVLVLVGATFSGGSAGFTVVGYHTWWMNDSWKGQDLTIFDDLVFFALNVEQDGNFESANGWPMRWGNLVHSAQNEGTDVMPSITLLDARKFSVLFSNETHQRTLLRNVLDAVRYANADGVHLDFEVFDPVSPRVRANYTRFVSDLRRALNRQRPGLKLYIFTLALDPGNVYDEAALARSADFLIVQGYDLHWKGGSQAGPVSPLRGWGVRNWENILQKFDDAGVPRNKILMSIPYYGYEWPTMTSEPGAATRGVGETITFAPTTGTTVTSIRTSAKQQIARFGERRDPISGSPYYAYRSNNGWHQGWYEDARSLAEKYEFIRSKGLGGVAVFALSYDDGQLQSTLKRGFGR